MIQPWRQISSRARESYKVFSVREERRLSPRTGREHDFFIIDAANWVNVVALTPACEIILIEQYRHGSNTVELEIPGGVMDPSDPTPELAGVRELLEETGYQGSEPIRVGDVLPNPAIMSNHCYTVLVQNCRQVESVKWDDGEDMATKLVPLAELQEIVAAGKIRHSLVVAALYQFDLWWKKFGQNSAEGKSG